MSKYEAQKVSEKSIKARLTRFYQNTKRIVKVASKPSRKEYWLVTKICLIGIVILGVLSYVIQLIFSVIPIGS
jgi:protein translocase SEC61 complex gamma subunit